jgi:predicted ribosomally synthesized peptide with SipW-like signal peptide
MKRKLLAGALIAVCLSIAAYGTVAYFTAEDTAANTITAGNIEIDLLDSAQPEDGITIMPGTESAKTVKVENTGDHPAYIRILLDKSIVLADGVEGETDSRLIDMDINIKDWTEKDGYYYYNKPLAAGETTEPLFTKISFSKDMNNLYQNSKAVIIAYASAVQSENNGANVMEATGWPAE